MKTNVAMCPHLVSSPNQIYIPEEDGEMFSISKRSFDTDGEKSLQSLQSRQKWNNKGIGFEAGDMVILKEQDCHCHCYN